MLLRALLFVLWCALPFGVHADPAWQVVDIPTRAGVTQRFLHASPDQPAATLILFAGGHGGLQIATDGSMRWGEGNFLVRMRNQFVSRGDAVVVVDAPSDRQDCVQLVQRRAAPCGAGTSFMAGFRQRPEHAQDIAAVIAWARARHPVPVWLVGTSRGTQSAASVATKLGAAPAGPDGLVLTSTIVSDGGNAVNDMPLASIRVPVLVVHHEQDGCRLCPFDGAKSLVAMLTAAPRKELVAITGGTSTGDPCEARAYHGFNGVDTDVVQRIADWIGRRG